MLSNITSAPWVNRQATHLLNTEVEGGNYLQTHAVSFDAKVRTKKLFPKDTWTCFLIPESKINN